MRGAVEGLATILSNFSGCFMAYTTDTVQYCTMSIAFYFFCLAFILTN